MRICLFLEVMGLDIPYFGYKYLQVNVICKEKGHVCSFEDKNKNVQLRTQFYIKSFRMIAAATLAMIPNIQFNFQLTDDSFESVTSAL